MAGVVRLSSGRIVQKYFCRFSNQTVRRNFKLKKEICFHTSSFLNVLGQEINMPSLSPTMTEGTIVQWLKKEGDTIAPGDVLCEIQTDKAVMAFETEEEGILAKILIPSYFPLMRSIKKPICSVYSRNYHLPLFHPDFLLPVNPFPDSLVVDPGTKDIKVGSLIALMVAEGEDWRAVEIPSSAGSGKSGGGVQSSSSGSAASGGGSSKGAASGGSVPGQPVKMPALSPTMTEGTIVAWKKKEGDKISPGDALCEIQTDKAVMTFETEEEGILAKILVPEGTANVQVGALIAMTVEEGADWKNVQVSADAAAAPTPAATATEPVAQVAFTGGSVPGTEVKMPALSPTMTEGTIVAWKKKEGDKISPGDALCEIQTDKAIMTFELEEEGVLAKILYPEGSERVKVGSLIALTVEEGADWKDVRIPMEGSPAAPAPVVHAVAGGTVPGFEVKMPSLSPTMTEGQIVNWLKKEGDKISPGDVLCEIQTDKAVMSFEVEEEGILAKILAPAGTAAVKVGSLIALTVEEGKDWKDVAIPVVAGHAPAPVKPPTPAVAPTPAAPSPVTSGYHLVGDFAPAVRALLERYQLTGKEVQPTGPKNKILKGDVLKYIRDNNLQQKPPVPVPLPGQKPTAAGIPSPKPSVTPSPAEPTPVVIGRKRTGFTDKEISTMRRTIAKRLTQSKTEIPHAYSTLNAAIDDLISARKQLKNLGIKVSVNDFVIKSVASALQQCRFLNTLYVNDQITPSKTIDISVAVATENGLITPIVKNADQKALDVISGEVHQLANKARQGKLQLHEFQGGSFTISNLGMFGIREFSAIINPPQCAILAVGGGQKLIKPDGSTATMMSATLSYDARAIGEDEVAAFMEVLKGYLENPASFLLSSQRKPKFLSRSNSLDFL